MEGAYIQESVGANTCTRAHLFVVVRRRMASRVDRNKLRANRILLRIDGNESHADGNVLRADGNGSHADGNGSRADA